MAVIAVASRTTSASIFVANGWLCLRGAGLLQVVGWLRGGSEHGSLTPANPHCISAFADELASSIHIKAEIQSSHRGFKLQPFYDLFWRCTLRSEIGKHLPHGFAGVTVMVAG